MNNLKKRLGMYKAADVDMLLFKVRSDYEKCLKEQKERIFQLREENRAMALTIEELKSNEKYIVSAIAKAEETAQSIIKDAENKARERLARAQSEEKQIRLAVEGCCERLYKLKRASEAIYRAVSKVIGEHDEEEKTRAVHPGIYAVKVFPGTQLKDKA